MKGNIELQRFRILMTHSEWLLVFISYLVLLSTATIIFTLTGYKEFIAVIFPLSSGYIAIIEGIYSQRVRIGGNLRCRI